MGALTLVERKTLYRERVESQETYRDYVIDVVGVWGPLLAPAVPAALTMVSIMMHYPALLDIHWIAAVAIGLIVAVVIEVLGVVSVETFLDMKSYNQTIDEDEELAPVGWAGAIMGLYIAIVISLVVLLKMVPALALISLVPLTLLAGVTSWIVVMRKQHRQRVFRKEVAEMEARRKGDLTAIMEELRLKVETLEAENGKLTERIQQEVARNRQFQQRIDEQRERLEQLISERNGLLPDQVNGAIPAAGNQLSGFGAVALPFANEKRNQNVENRRAAISGILETGAEMTTAEIQERLQAMGFTSGIGERTVRDDLKVLGAERNGHRWRMEDDKVIGGR